MKLLIPVLIALVLCAVAHAEGGGAADLPDAANAVSIAAKGMSLKDIADSLQQKTGVRLRVVREIADCRATVFVTNLPLKDVMSGIARVFGFRWSRKDYKGQAIYELWQPENVRQQRQSFDRIEAAWAALDRTLADQAGGAGGKSYVSPLAIEISRLYTSLPAELKQAIHERRQLRFSSWTEEPRWRLSSEVVSAITAAIPMGDGENAEIPVSNKLAVRLVPIFDGGNVSLLADIEAGRSIRQWVASCGLPNDVGSTPTEQISDSAITAKLMSIGKDDLSLVCRPQGVASVTPELLAANVGYINRSDLLELIHKATGANVFSDHYSKYTGSDRVCLAQASVRALLSVCSQCLWQPIRVWTEDNSLFTRVQDPATADMAEIPESVCRHWASSYLRDGALGLDDMVAVCTLTDDQLMTIGHPAFMPRLGVLTSPNACSRGVADQIAAAFYAALTPQERAQAEGSGLPIEGLSWRQKARLVGMRQIGPERTPEDAGIYLQTGERIDQLPPGDKQPTRLTISRELPEGKTGVGFTFTFLFADGHERVVPYVLSR